MVVQKVYEKGPPWLKFTDLLVAITNLLTKIYLHLCMEQRAEVKVSHCAQRVSDWWSSEGCRNYKSQLLHSAVISSDSIDADPLKAGTYYNVAG